MQLALEFARGGLDAHHRALARTDGAHARGGMRHRGDEGLEALSRVALKRNERAEEKGIRDEASRSVDRIENPAVAHAARGGRSRLLDAVLLAENSVLGEALLDHGAHHALGTLVGFGHGRAVDLVVDVNAGEELFADHAEGCVDQFI